MSEGTGTATPVQVNGLFPSRKVFLYQKNSIYELIVLTELSINNICNIKLRLVLALKPAILSTARMCNTTETITTAISQRFFKLVLFEIISDDYAPYLEFDCIS